MRIFTIFALIFNRIGFIANYSDNRKKSIQSSADTGNLLRLNGRTSKDEKVHTCGCRQTGYIGLGGGAKDPHSFFVYFYINFY